MMSYREWAVSVVQRKCPDDENLTMALGPNKKCLCDTGKPPIPVGEVNGQRAMALMSSGSTPDYA